MSPDLETAIKNMRTTYNRQVAPWNYDLQNGLIRDLAGDVIQAYEARPREIGAKCVHCAGTGYGPDVRAAWRAAGKC